MTLEIATLLLCIASAAVGGVFIAFSTFVMKALSQLPASQGIAAMQRINVVVINPLFLGLFLGTVLLAIGCCVAGYLWWGVPRSQLLLLSMLLYGLGCFGVTMLFNVPRNDRLAKMESSSEEAILYWPIYQREWLFWNHVRAAASLLAAVAAGVAIL